jgi:hypothetical protein
MPRPSPNDRRKIEARKKANARLRAEQTDKDALIRKRVEGLLDNALNRSRARDRELLPDVAEIVEQLAEARIMALSVYPPQTQAAINASMATARLLGYVIDKSAVAVAGQVSVFGAGSRKEPQSIEEVIEDFRESHGDRAAQRYIEIMRAMGIEYDGPDVDPVVGRSMRCAMRRRLGNGDANGAADG